MEKKTKHGEWEGHRLFCQCDDGVQFEGGEIGYTPEENEDRCPKTATIFRGTTSTPLTSLNRRAKWLSLKQ